MSNSPTVKNTFLKNSALLGAGAMGVGDRGGWSTVSYASSNPYNQTDFVTRWRQAVQLYETSWEARKIVRIPVEDALRKPWSAENIPEDIASGISAALNRLRFMDTLKRALMLERLLGGCLVFLGLESDDDEPEKRYKTTEARKLRFINAIPISRIARITWDTDPLSPGYMRPEKFLVNGQTVHVSRCLVFDGEPLFDPYDFALTNFRANLAGFGPSVLWAIWDDIIKAIGTRQAAYQLIQTNNSIIAAIQDLQDLSGTNPGKRQLEKLKEIANSLSLFRAAIIDGEKVDIKSIPASFGSVPELMMAFIQILSAASDIPATRFLGQAPGGLNATGESDLENYYNKIDAYQQQRICPELYKVYDVLGYEMYPSRWSEARRKLEFKFPPMWNASELEQAQRNQLEIDNIFKAWEAGLMPDEKAVEELNAKGVFTVELDVDEIVVKDIEPVDDPVDPVAEVQRLRNVNPLVGLLVRAGGDPSTIDVDEFIRGLAAEHEHAATLAGDGAPDDIQMAKITLDHLREDPQYYSKLAKIENSLASRQAQLHVDANEAATAAGKIQPSRAQLDAGLYRKGRVKIHGLTISIENPAGSVRSGVDERGVSWSQRLNDHYGYILGTIGRDKDHLDVFVGDDPDATMVFIVDQVALTDGRPFDEHKIMLGYSGTDHAQMAYLRNYDESGAERLGAITGLSMRDFKKWLKTDTTSPYAYQGGA